MSKIQKAIGKVLEAEHTLSEEVPVGYKRTEVGMIPEEWSIQQLKTICDVRDGTHESPRFYSSGIPLITSKNIVNGGLDLENISCISEQDADRINKRSKVDLNDILMSMIGTIGSTVLIDFEPDFCIKNVALIKPQKVLPIFLIHLMASPLFQTYLKDSLDGGIQKFIALGTLRHLNIPLPPPTEQRAIAEALSDVDGLLGALEALIAKKRAIKQAAMQQLLTGKIRLPGFSGTWETRRLGDVAHIKTGSRNNQDKVDDGQYPFFVRSSTVERINSYAFEGEAILVPGECDIGGIFHYINGRFDVHQRVYQISRFSTEVCGKFIYYSMILYFGVHAMLNTVKATVDSLRLPTFKNFSLSLPRVEEQSAIARLLSDMDAEIAALERRRDKTRTIKQGMMQQLLTGRVRLV